MLQTSNMTGNTLAIEDNTRLTASFYRLRFQSSTFVPLIRQGTDEAMPGRPAMGS
jgi:hypothetical protein